MKLNNNEIEQAMLGLMISEPKALIKGLEYLKPNDFFDLKNKITFEMLKESVSDQKIDLNILINNINKNISASKALQGGSYIHFLITQSGYLSSLDEYLDNIQEFSNLKSLEEIVKGSIKQIGSSANFNTIVSDVQQKIMNINSDSKLKFFVEAKDVISELIEKISKMANQEDFSGLLTGFSDLDNITNGLQNGDLIIIAARPSMGKTALALNIAANISKQHNVALFSLEMPAEQLVTRLISIFSNLETNKLKKASLMQEGDWKKLYSSQNIISKLKLFIDDSPTLKLEELLWKARRLKRENKLDLIVIDYLQLIPTSSQSYSENRQQEVSKISRTLKQLARELDVPVIALSQLSRKVEQREDKTPMMSDLRESGAIEQDADIIAFLYREEYYNKKNEENKSEIQDTSIIISKHRNGAIGTINLLFNPTKGQFNDKKE